MSLLKNLCQWPYSLQEPHSSISDSDGGKNTKTTQLIDEMSKEEILKSFQKIEFYDGVNIYEAPKLDLDIDIPARPPALCPGCLHRDIYYAIMKVFKSTKQARFVSTHDN